MELYFAAIYILLANISLASAKINGGPRGRFDKDKQPTRPQGQVSNHVRAHHSLYSYHPPKHIYYLCRHCTTMNVYPVYYSLPPTYVYKFRESHIKFGALLTGLALYNLGRSNENQRTHFYTPRDDEKCSMQLIDQGRFEETLFPCFMMSTFVNGDKPQDKQERDLNVHAIDISTTQANVKPYLQNHEYFSTATPVEVTGTQECVIWHNTTREKQKDVMPCGLLKKYSETMVASGVPEYVWLPITVAVVVAIAVSCQTCRWKKKVYKDDTVLNHVTADRYLA